MPSPQKPFNAPKPYRFAERSKIATAQSDSPVVERSKLVFRQNKESLQRLARYARTSTNPIQAESVHVQQLEDRDGNDEELGNGQEGTLPRPSQRTPPETLVVDSLVGLAGAIAGLVQPVSRYPICEADGNEESLQFGRTSPS